MWHPSLHPRCWIATLALLLFPIGAAHAEGWRISADTLAYSDNDNVNILSPQLTVHRVIDEDGGEATAQVVVDVISAASVDVVSQATPRFSEVRSEASLGVSHYIFGMLPELGYRYSHEPDYESHTLRGGIEREVLSADTVVRAGYGITFDRVGLHGTPYSIFSESLTTHAADLGVTQVIDAQTLVRAVYTLTVQDGYQEKPYRLVPLFATSTLEAADAAGVVLDLDNFDDYRLPQRVPESVPERRVRQAIALRGLRYLESIEGSARVDYQFYFDSWGITAHVLEPVLTAHLTESFIGAIQARLYRQSSADFWSRTYAVDDPMSVPRWRTMDRDLSAYWTLAGGVRVEWTNEPLSAYLEANAMETFYDDYLFLDRRFALYGLGGLRWDF